jgi:hypothetical protein
VRRNVTCTLLPPLEIVPASTFSIERHLPLYRYLVFDPPHSVSA